MPDKSARYLIGAYVCITLGGFLLHFKNHPPGLGLYFWLAAPVSAFSLIVITILLSFRATVAWGYMLNAATVLIGLVAMGFYSFFKAEGSYTLSYFLLESTLPYILLLLAKLPLAHAILVRIRPEKPVTPVRGCR